MPVHVISYDGTEIPGRERPGPTGVEYTFPLTIPATKKRVTVIARIAIRSDRLRPIVHVKDAPDCRRHRYNDQSLACGSTQTPRTANGPCRTAWIASLCTLHGTSSKRPSAEQVTRGWERSRPARMRVRRVARPAAGRAIDVVVTALICGHALGDLVRDFGPMLALLGGAATLLGNGVRDERRRRRDIHARALEAVAQYYEMPFLIRRRRHDEPSLERARLTERSPTSKPNWPAARR